MKRTPSSRSASRLFRNEERGFYLIGLLMVLVIIMILSGRSFHSASGTNPGSVGDSAASILLDPLAAGAGQVQDGNNRIDQTKVLTCSTNRTQLATDMTMLSMGNSGVIPAPAVVSNKLGHIGCPTGGQYQYDEHGRIYCSEHAPAPAGAEVRNL